MKSMLRILTVILAVVSAGVAAHAQEEEYKFDIGAGVGMSGYLGDVNHSNLFRRPGFVGQLSFRYLIDTRWAIRGLFTAASLSGTTADMDNVLPEGKVYDFKSWVYDLGGRVEFNFFNYGIGESYKNLSRVSPYLSLGLGVTMSNTAGESYVAMSLPMGFGVKYKVKSRVNLSLEFCMTKVFGDHVDSGELSDLYQIKSSFLKNTDWYSTIMLGISYEFGKLCVTCHRID